MCISHTERVFVDCLDWSPDIDDLVAGLQEVVSDLWEVMGDAGARGFVGLVDMNAIHRASKCCGWGTDVFRLAANGMVEDEDSACAGTAEICG